MGTEIDVTYKNGEANPAGDRIKVAVREPIISKIDADAPGELHVHSTEGLEIQFEAGVSEHSVTVDQPGVVEVELHGPDLVVVQLEVE